MTKELFSLLCVSIPKAFISVDNYETYSRYYFYMPEGPAKDSFVEIFCSYSYSDQRNIYAIYELYIDEKLISNARQAVFTKAKQKKANIHMTESDRLEILLKLCSTKVIVQEIESHKTHMLKTLSNPINQHIN